jgi:tRNA(fMet)-specific endonuclease VapC
MYLLHTNHCSRIISGDAALLQMLQHHLEEGVATSCDRTR